MGFEFLQFPSSPASFAPINMCEHYLCAPRWKKDWVPQEDALCLAIKIQGKGKERQQLQDLCEGNGLACKPLPPVAVASNEL